MVQFNEKGYTITITTNINPIEDWLLLKKQLLNVISMIPEDEDVETFELFNLLKDLEINLEQAQKVLPYKTNPIAIKQPKEKISAWNQKSLTETICKAFFIALIKCVCIGEISMPIINY